MNIGIQGGPGSTNEQALGLFSEQLNIKTYATKYLIHTENVLEALEKGVIDRGVFAWKSSRVGVVEESEKAVPKYKFKVVDSVEIELNHALFAAPSASIDITEPVHIYSHPQALRIHSEYFTKIFPTVTTHSEEDTALAAEKISKGAYPKNSLAIAPLQCAERYNLQLVNPYLPGNIDYITTFWMVERC